MDRKSKTVRRKAKLVGPAKARPPSVIRRPPQVEHPQPVHIAMPGSKWAIELASFARTQMQAKYFVETGTCHGWTAARASGIFEQVYTIEIDHAVSHKAAARYPRKNVRWLAGNSPELLRGVVLPEIGSARAVFWLDAHCCDPANLPFGQHECPILDELSVIYSHSHEHFVMIDDARLFLAPPPIPHRLEDWPHIRDLISYTPDGASVLVMEDVIVIPPSDLMAALIDMWRHRLLH